MAMQEVVVLDGGGVRAALAGLEAELVDAVRLGAEKLETPAASRNTSLFDATQITLADPIERLTASPILLRDALLARHPVDHEAAAMPTAIVLHAPSEQTPMIVVERAALRAKRAGAMAALAASRLSNGPENAPLGVVGCTEANAECVAGLAALYPKLTSLLVYDRDASRAVAFTRQLSERFPRLQLSIAGSVGLLFSSCKLVTIATNASQPYIDVDVRYVPGATLLQLSRHDLAPEVIAMSRVVVDDIERQCAEGGSLSAAERLIGHRNFITCRFGDVLLCGAQPRRSPAERLVYLGQGDDRLDVAVAQLVAAAALATGVGVKAKADIAEKVLFVSRR